MRRRVLNKDVASALGISASMVSRHAKRGMPTHDLDLARTWYETNVSPSLRKDRRRPDEAMTLERSATELAPPQPQDTQGAATPEPWTFRQRKDFADARLAELDLQEREGTLVKVADVQAGARRLASAIVQQMESIPDRIAAEFGVDDAMRSKIRQRLREEHDRIRAEIARAGAHAVQ